MAIERLRALAALMVILFHLSQYHSEFYGRFVGSPYGVDLFFVVSGFVVSRSFLRSLESCSSVRNLARFYCRRIFRIVPLAALWCGIALIASRYFNRSGEFSDYPHVAQMVWQIATLRFNYFYITHRHAILGHYWTLMVEEHFYIFLPLFLLSFRSNRARLAGAVAGILTVTYIFIPLTIRLAPPALTSFYLILATHTRIHELFLGVAIYLFTEIVKLRPERWRTSCAALCSWLLIAIITMFWPAQNWHVFQPLAGYPWIFWSCGVLVFIASFDGGSVAGFFDHSEANRLLGYLGSRSYGIYLAHPLLILFLDECVARWGWPLKSIWTWTPVYFVLLFSVTEFFYRMVELPLIQWGRIIAGRPAASGPRVSVSLP